MSILAELKGTGLICTQANHVETYAWSGRTLRDIGDVIQTYDVLLERKNLSNPDDPRRIYYGAPAGVRSGVMGSQSCSYEVLDGDREAGCIRRVNHAYSKDGGLAVLYGNLAPEGCIVKTAGVHPSMLTREGQAIVFDSQEAAMEAILNGTVQPGHAVVIRFEGPKGGPGMQEMLYPTTYLKQRKLDLACFLVTDGRFSGGTSGPCIGHISPEAASGGLIGLIRNGDVISYDIPNRTINVNLTEGEILKRTLTRPKPNRDRVVSDALKRYAYFVTSASEGAIQKLP
jgi:dihydroxy-acid dehydratase